MTIEINLNKCLLTACYWDSAKTSKRNVFTTVLTIGIIFVVIYLSYQSHWYNVTPITTIQSAETVKPAGAMESITTVKITEAHNSTSPFYGLLHKNTYGLPLSYFSVPPFQISKNDWKDFFPHVVKALEQLQAKNPASEVEFFTRSFAVTSTQLSYKTGDEFVATITSMDGKGRPKSFGGDYYRARLVRGNQIYPDGIPCRVTDNHNGTYTVNAPLVLKGSLKLEVKLVSPIETINEMIKQTEKLSSWGVPFYATLEKGEVVKCNVDLTFENG